MEKQRQQETVSSRLQADLASAHDLIESGEVRIKQTATDKEKLAASLAEHHASEASELQRSLERARRERDALIRRHHCTRVAAEKLVGDLSMRDGFESLALQQSSPPPPEHVGRAAVDVVDDDASSSVHTPPRMPPRRPHSYSSPSAVAALNSARRAKSSSPSSMAPRTPPLASPPYHTPAGTPGSGSSSPTGTTGERKRLHTCLAEFVLAMR